jgi:hypothetical protein
LIKSSLYSILFYTLTKWSAAYVAIGPNVLYLT